MSTPEELIQEATCDECGSKDLLHAKMHTNIRTVDGTLYEEINKNDEGKRISGQWSDKPTSTFYTLHLFSMKCKKCGNQFEIYLCMPDQEEK